MFESQEPPECLPGDGWSAFKHPSPWKLRGWMAAKPFGLLTHHLSATKPCTDELTKEVVTCYGCRGNVKKEYKCYVPLYSPRDGRVVVVLNREQYDKCKLFPERCEVIVSRGKGYHDKITINEVPEGQLSAVPESISLLEDIDIRPFLIRIWALPLLTAWWVDQQCKTTGQQDVNLNVDEPKKKQKVKKTKLTLDLDGPVSLTESEEIQKIVAQQRERAASLGLPNLAAKIKPSTNGKH